MCEDHVVEDVEPLPTGRRRKLWEIRHDLHCAILGTCLSYAELEKVGRKAGFVPTEEATEYDVHTCLVKRSAEPGTLSRLLHKLLDRKYRSAIDAFRSVTGEADLAAMWDQALRGGDIPGSYWAVVSHPLVTEKLLIRTFGDVHMLSHIAGAANRADIRRLKEVQAENRSLSEQLAGLRRRLAAQQEAHGRAAKRHAEEMKTVSRRLKAAETAETRIAGLEAQLADYESGDAHRRLQSENASLKAEAEDARLACGRERRRCADLKRELGQVQQAREESADQVRQLHAECEALEAVVASGNHREAVRSAPDMPALDLDGRHIAYVGGLTGSVGRFRTLTENLNGRFIHHDGGVEDNSAGLGRVLNQADVVLCPVDCVSHGACLRAKRFCKQTAKTFVPLRSAGLSSFVAGLQEVVGQNGRTH